jgi:acetyl esterase
MKEFTKSFKKIIPYLRSTTMEAIECNPLQGERLEIPGESHIIEVYFHRANSKNAPVLFELHGGGFVLGHAAKNDALRELIKNQLDIHVVGINYRKAPEHPYPAATIDVLTVMRFFSDHAKQYSVDPERYAVTGYSAGANLATVACMKSKDELQFRIRCQILHYPFLDTVADTESRDKYPADLPCEVIDAFVDLYTSEEERGLPWVSPVYASKEILMGMPPAVIVIAKEDGLSKEGLLYAKLLEEAGVPTESIEIEYAHHGYIEDYYNKAYFESIPEDTKASYRENFGEAAENAIQLTIKRLEKYLQ